MANKLITVHSRHFFNFIEILHQEQERVWSGEYKENDKFSALIDELGRNNWFKVDSADITALEKIWNDRNVIDLEEITQFGNKVFYLPPIEKGGNYFAVMSIKVNCNVNDYIASIRVMLLTPKSPSDVNDKSPFSFWGVGFRIENGDGRHNYHHAQIISDFKGSSNANNFFESVSWLPETHPAFPLKANEPLTLILSLYLTLYGLDGLRNFSTYSAKMNSIWTAPEVKEFRDFLSAQPKPKKRK